MRFVYVDKYTYRKLKWRPTCDACIYSIYIDTFDSNKLAAPENTVGNVNKNVTILLCFACLHFDLFGIGFQIHKFVVRTIDESYHI